MWSIDDFFIHPLFIKVEGDKKFHIIFFSLLIYLWYFWTLPLEVRLFISSHSSMITLLYGYVYLLLFKSESFIMLVTCYTEVEKSVD